MIHEFSYPCQRHVGDAPIGSMTSSFRTCGSGRRQTLVAASASRLTRVSLYSKTVPGSCRSRVSQVRGSRSGRSAQSGFPHSVPSQSEV